MLTSFTTCLHFRGNRVLNSSGQSNEELSTAPSKLIVSPLVREGHSLTSIPKDVTVCEEAFQPALPPGISVVHSCLPAVVKQCPW